MLFNQLLPSHLFSVVIISLFISACTPYKQYSLTTLTIKHDYMLTHDLTNTNIIITHPNVTLNLNGYTLKGNCNQKCIGIHVKPKAHHTTIINGQISHFLAGISVDKKAHHATFNNITVTNNIHHGIYVHTGANQFSCTHCTIRNNGTMGIYLDHNTHHALITKSQIINNGYRYKNTGSLKKNVANLFKQSREGIAIDASQHNEISHTYFANNALAAINLYKNCGEHGFKRQAGANNNWIHHNIFNQGNVHIASRQDRDLSSWDCLEPYILHNRYVRDEAQFNTISHNQFNQGAVLIIHDDYNQAHHNQGVSIITQSFVRTNINQPIQYHHLINKKPVN